MRVITARCSAALAWRLPPRLSRKRVIFPEEAGMGLVPQSAAKAASLWSRAGCRRRRAGARRRCRVPPGQRGEGRRSRLCQVGKVLTKVLGLGPQGQGSAGQQAKGVLRRRQRGGGLTGAQGRTALQQRHQSGPVRDSRSSQGAVTSTALSWLTACVWALTAESRVSFR